MIKRVVLSPSSSTLAKPLFCWQKGRLMNTNHMGQVYIWTSANSPHPWALIKPTLRTDGSGILKRGGLHPTPTFLLVYSTHTIDSLSHQNWKRLPLTTSSMANYSLPLVLSPLLKNMLQSLWITGFVIICKKLT